MERILVTSTTLRSVGYDPIDHLLELEFVSGALYEYYDVPLDVYQGLKEAESHGQYFNYHIKQAGFEFRQVI